MKLSIFLLTFCFIYCCGNLHNGSKIRIKRQPFYTYGLNSVNLNYVNSYQQRLAEAKQNDVGGIGLTKFPQDIETTTRYYIGIGRPETVHDTNDAARYPLPSNNPVYFGAINQRRQHKTVILGNSNHGPTTPDNRFDPAAEAHIQKYDSNRWNYNAARRDYSGNVFGK